MASPWLWVSILVFAFINVTDAGPRAVAMPFLIHDHLGLDVKALGLVFSFFSAGSIVGALVLGRVKRLRRRARWMYGGVGLCGLMIVMYGLAPNLGLLLGAALIYGVSFSAGSLLGTPTPPEVGPQEQLGRVTSIDALGSFVLMPVGFALAGVLTDRIGPVLVFVYGGSLTVAVTILAYLHPGVRRLD